MIIIIVPAKIKIPPLRALMAPNNVAVAAAGNNLSVDPINVKNNKPVFS